MFRHDFGLEFGRLSALYRYGVLDTDPENWCDTIVEIVRTELQAPFAQLVFVDDDRLWAKSTSGTDLEEIRKQGSFSALALEQQGLMVVGDTHADPRVKRVDELSFRAYLGAPLRTFDSQAIGVLYAADSEARAWSPDQVARIEQGAAAIMRALEQRRQIGIDDDSGAMKRPAFEETVHRVGGFAVRHSRDVSLLVIDVDPFRSLVESFKIDLGRLLVQRVSTLGRLHLRRLDSFGRLSDSVFAVLLPGSGLDGARVLARRMIAKLAEGWSTTLLDGERTAIGIGLASLRAGPHQPWELIVRALEDCHEMIDVPTAKPSLRAAKPKVA